ncbi:chitinase 1 [Dendryphion nanum]|uniref:chitinase n=1 Tax=Dendryphion nanum TaxID=256645 RepID=A0A9P9EKT8_9PLEO|nr:chitinase 1 [Dendryphion nanum]
MTRLSLTAIFFSLLTFLVLTTPSSSHISSKKYIMYLTGQHPIIPSPPLISHITHVALAFMPSSIFNTPNATSWPLFTSVEETREKFLPGTKIMVAIGGWSDTAGFAAAARTEEGRRAWAGEVRRMVEGTGADGVDVDWEYPGGNGEDYKTHPNHLKTWEIDAYPLLLAELRSALGPSRLISAAIPGLPRDMLAFTSLTIPEIEKSVDFFNVMTYDMMNRRDNITKHHAGIELSRQAVDTYLTRGMSREKVNLGFAFYVKWFKTAPGVDCTAEPVGCATAVMENPETGADLGRAGAFSWHDDIPGEVSKSFARAGERGVWDEVGGGYGFWDGEEEIWWSWETEDGIVRKFGNVVREKDLGGAFAWGLGEDAEGFGHLRALNGAWEEWVKGAGGRKTEGGEERRASKTEGVGKRDEL